MTISVSTRQVVGPEDTARRDTKGLRDGFVIEGMFRPDEINLTYSHLDRMIVGGADSVVLVVQHGKTPTSAIKSAQRQLNIGGHARPAGIIINKAPKSRDLTEIGVSTRGEW